MPTIPVLLVERMERDADRPVLHVPEDRDHLGLGGPGAPGWRVYRGRDVLDAVAGLAARLRALGVGPGVPVAILAETSNAWTAVDLAVLALGGIVVGIYPTLTAEQAAAQLRRARARVCIVEDAALADKVVAHADELADLRHLLSLDDAPDHEFAGRSVPRLVPGAPDVDALRRSAEAVPPDAPATYVFTSGTTGEPRAAVLTHAHFDAIVRATREALPLGPGERSVVFLPMAHVFQRFALYRGLAGSVTGWFAADLSRLPEAIAACRPTVLTVVPRVLEKVRERAEAEAARHPLSHAVFRWAEAVGRARFRRAAAGRPPSRRLEAQHRLADRLVFRRVREALGGELRLVVSGGAPLPVDVAAFFEAAGIMVREGWGLTETCAPVTLNTERVHRPGSVGRPLPGIEVRIAEDGEVLVRGPGVFLGYLDDPEATAAAFTPDGRFRTGDLGVLDEDGFLWITGRKKEILVTAGGKNVAPAAVEDAIRGGIVGHVVVLGDRRPFLVALVWPSEEQVTRLARRHGWPGGPDEWRRRPEVRAAIDARIERANERLARFERVRRWALLPEEPTVEGGLLTPTLKPRRGEFERRFAELVEGLYRRSRPAPQPSPRSR